MKLIATDAANVPTGRSAFRMKNAFESEMKKVDAPITKIADDFKAELDKKIHRSLVRSLRTGAEKGSAVALRTVESWGSKNRRTKHERRPDKNGTHLFFLTSTIYFN